jgi:predicted ATPase
MKSERIKVRIDDLLLDPNNYRFVDKSEYKFIEEFECADPRVQQRTLNFIVGKNQEGIKDLIKSFKNNGFLDIDQIQVKRVNDQYLVLEGNRRTATLKYLFEEFEKGNDVGLLNADSFNKIDVVEIIGEDPAQHLITMGLHHISGKKRWSAVNEAKLLADLRYNHQMSESSICDKLGISTNILRRSLRTYYLIEQYKESDFGDQFTTDMFSIFQTLVSSPKLKEWVEWDDYEYRAENKINIDRFFKWISEDEVVNEESEKKDRIIIDPIIIQSSQVKEIEEFINDEKALKVLEESRSISEAYSMSKTIGKNKLKDAIDSLTYGVNLAPNFRELMTTKDFDTLNNVKDKIESLIPSSQANFLLNEKRAEIYYPKINSHFKNIHISKYRKLEDLDIKNISRINLIAGDNNKGKTTILEAVYLLTQLNDLNSYIELERFRGKFYNKLQATWIEKNFMSEISLKANFNSDEIGLTIVKESTNDDIDRIGYRNTLVSDANINSLTLNSLIHLYSNKEPQYKYTVSHTLCASAFSSPYRHNQLLLHAAHNLAIENKYYESVIGFIRDTLDSSIEKIDLVNDEGEFRFRVTSSKFEKAIDLTKYGEGLQRVFEIALLLGYCQNGVLCIDEVDSALHKNLLLAFTAFIQKVATAFNVQVFISTHSKECIDAFVENDFPDNELTAFAIEEGDNGQLECNYLTGIKLKELVDSINIDIR